MLRAIISSFACLTCFFQVCRPYPRQEGFAAAAAGGYPPYLPFIAVDRGVDEDDNADADADTNADYDIPADDDNDGIRSK